VTAFVITELT